MRCPIMRLVAVSEKACVTISEEVFGDSSHDVKMGRESTISAKYMIRRCIIVFEID